MQDDIVIRRSRPADAEVIINGIQQICTEGGAFYVTHFEPSLQWQAVLNHPESVPENYLIIAELNGQLLGSGRLFPGQHNSLHRHVVELGMFVLKPYRRQGIGTQLLESMLEWTSARSLTKIVLCVFATNTAAIQLYKKYDFQIEGRQRKQIKVDGDYIDLLWMARFFV